MFCINYYFTLYFIEKKIGNSTSARNGIRGFSEAYLCTLYVCWILNGETIIVHICEDRQRMQNLESMHFKQIINETYEWRKKNSKKWNNSWMLDGIDSIFAALISDRKMLFIRNKSFDNKTTSKWCQIPLRN